MVITSPCHVTVTGGQLSVAVTDAISGVASEAQLTVAGPEQVIVGGMLSTIIMEAVAVALSTLASADPGGGQAAGSAVKVAVAVPDA